MVAQLHKLYLSASQQALKIMEDVQDQLSEARVLPTAEWFRHRSLILPNGMPDTHTPLW